MKKIPALLILLLSVSSAYAKAKSQTNSQAPPMKKHALVKVALAVATPVTKPVSFFKKSLGVILFGVEVPVDGVHAAFFGADKVFDVLSLGGRFPTLDMIYAGVSIGDTDTGKLDKFLENTEDKLFGHHN